MKEIEVLVMSAEGNVLLTEIPFNTPKKKVIEVVKAILTINKKTHIEELTDVKYLSGDKFYNTMEKMFGVMFYTNMPKDFLYEHKWITLRNNRK